MKKTISFIKVLGFIFEVIFLIWCFMNILAGLIVTLVGYLAIFWFIFLGMVQVYLYRHHNKWWVFVMIAFILSIALYFYWALMEFSHVFPA